MVDDVKDSAPVKMAAADTKLVWIQLDEHDDIPKDGLSVSHNGVGYLIKAGEPVQVPHFLLGVLDESRFDYREVDAPSKQEQKDAAK